MPDIIVKMPQLGESLTEGTVGKWLKKVGEPIVENEDLFEVLSDKMNTEIPAEASGTLKEILVQEGQTVDINTPLAVISTEAVAAATAEAPTAAAAAVTTAQSEGKVNAPATAAPSSSSNGTDTHTGLYPSDPSNMIALPSTSKPAALPTASTAENAARWREKSSPLVRSILTEHNMELSVLDQIQGSGANGRVNKDDVLAFIAKGAQAPAQPQPVAQPAAVPQPIAATPQPLPVPQGVPSWIPIPSDTDAEVQPLAGIRKIIAERLTYSETVAPHVTTFAEVDVTDLVAFRAKHKQWVADDYGANLTFLPFVIRAIASGLKAFPAINSSLIGDQLYTHKRIHVAIAVSLDQTGLMLPIIKNADQKGVIELAKEISDLAAAARSNKLTPDQMRGSTFTLSNPGAFGGWISTPIINQPNAAILNTGTIKKMPWVMPDDSIVARSIMFLSLSYDHRIVDGETSVKFLQHIKKTLENVERSFLL